jgi:hypothetical protein
MNFTKSCSRRNVLINIQRGTFLQYGFRTVHMHHHMKNGANMQRICQILESLCRYMDEMLTCDSPVDLLNLLRDVKEVQRITVMETRQFRKN